MIFQETPLKGAFVIDLELKQDDRGFLARTRCQNEFATHGLNPRLVQASMSYSRRRGTLRGLHYQAAPYEEAKLVRCLKGAMYDVIVDLRLGSATHLQWAAVTLTAANRKMLYVPEGFAHGYQTLEDDTEVSYEMSEFFVPDAARGARWDDPAFGIVWPEVDTRVISLKDQNWPPHIPMQGAQS